VSGDGGCHPVGQCRVVRTFSSESKLHLGMRRRPDPICATAFSRPSRVGALFGRSQFKRGRGVSGPKKDFDHSASQRAPVIALADRGLFFSKSFDADPGDTLRLAGNCFPAGALCFWDGPPPGPSPLRPSRRAPANYTGALRFWRASHPDKKKPRSVSGGKLSWGFQLALSKALLSVRLGGAWGGVVRMNQIGQVS
jgi:hypothetical protein